MRLMPFLPFGSGSTRGRHKKKQDSPSLDPFEETSFSSREAHESFQSDSNDLLAPARSFCTAWGGEPLPWATVARALFESERRLGLIGASSLGRRLRRLFSCWGLLAHWAQENGQSSAAAPSLQGILRSTGLSILEALMREAGPQLDAAFAATLNGVGAFSTGEGHPSTRAKASATLSSQGLTSLKQAVDAAVASARFLLDHTPGALQQCVVENLDAQRHGLLLFAQQAELAPPQSWFQAREKALLRAPAPTGSASVDLDSLSERPDALLRSAFQANSVWHWIALVGFEIALMALFALGPTWLSLAGPSPDWRHALFSAATRAFFGFSAGGALARILEIGLIYWRSDAALRDGMRTSLRLREALKTSSLAAVAFGTVSFLAPFWI